MSWFFLLENSVIVIFFHFFQLKFFFFLFFTQLLHCQIWQIFLKLTYFLYLHLLFILYVRFINFISWNHSISSIEIILWFIKSLLNSRLSESHHTACWICCHLNNISLSFLSSNLFDFLTWSWKIQIYFHVRISWNLF